jgi:hypothetical protein
MAVSPELDAIAGATNTFAQVVEADIEAALRRTMDDALDDGVDARAVISGVLLGVAYAMGATLRYLERIAEVTPVKHDAGSLARIYICMLGMYFTDCGDQSWSSRSVPQA